MLFSPLEQFSILPLINIFRGNFIYFSVTNETLILFLLLFFSAVFFKSLLFFSKDNTLSAVPTHWQALIELNYNLILSLILENIKDKKAQAFFPLISTLFSFILLLNLIGLVPYSFTLTSHLILTFLLSVSIFFGINVLAVKKHGIKFFALFLPTGTSVALAFLLTPIEVISYIFKPISLGIRLFANMMAGHTLLKVIAGFCATLATSGSFFLVLLHFVPLLILVPLFALELGVALIQAFVFSILICIYLQDSLYSSH